MTAGDYAFAGTGVTKVVIPSSMTVIPQGMFANCVDRSEEHTSELQSRGHLVCRLLLEKKKKKKKQIHKTQQNKYLKD